MDYTAPVHPCTLGFSTLNHVQIFSHRKLNKPSTRIYLIWRRERGIRTLDTELPYTRFPGVRLQPLGHLSDTHIFISKQNSAKADFQLSLLNSPLTSQYNIRTKGYIFVNMLLPRSITQYKAVEAQTPATMVRLIFDALAPKKLIKEKTNNEAMTINSWPISTPRLNARRLCHIFGDVT